MKEQEAIRLTNKQSAPTLNAGGDIFMAEPGSGEGKPMNRAPGENQRPENQDAPKPQERKIRFVSPEQAKLAWQRYDEKRTAKGEVISSEQGQAERIMAERGILPQSGGAPQITEKYIDSRLQKIVSDYNAMALGTDPTRPLSLSELRELVDRVVKARNDPAVNSDESLRLMSYLSDQARQAQGEKNKGQQGESAYQPRPIDTSGITDTDSLNFIDKFNQEIGYRDKGRIEQLKKDLNQRITNLENQRKSQSADTEAGTKEIERLDAEITRLRDIFPDLSDMLFARESRERMSEEERALFDRTDELLQNLQKANLNPDILNLDPNDIARLTPEQMEAMPGIRVARASLVKDIEDFIKDANPVETGGFPSEMLRIIRYFKELREGLVSELIFKPYEDPSETGGYEMDLYASSNLNTLLGFMSRDDTKGYRYFFSLKTAAHYFHSMNAGILTGNFESFGRIAETINYQHFKNMEEIRGIGPIMRLYEQKYKYYLGKDTRITEEGYTALKIEIEKTFRDMNKKGLVRSEYEQYRQGVVNKDVEHQKSPWEMEEWEINRALGAGRAFFNITLRGAENIATGQIPEDRKQFASFPQEDMVRVLNWNEWFLRRFKFGSKRHGVEFLGMVTEKHQEFMRYMGEKLDPKKDGRANKIIEFGGVNTRKMENGGQYHTSGVYSGWRMENLAFDQVYFNLDGNRISVQHFMDNVIDKDAVKAIKDGINAKIKANPNMNPTDAVTLGDQQRYRDLFMPLVDNLDIGLSMLIKNGNIGGAKKLGYLLREKIWEKIANKNTSLMIDYLTGLQAPGSDLCSLETILKDSGVNWSEEIEVGKDKEGKEIKKTRLEIFREKVLLRHEREMKEAMGKGNQLQLLSSEEEYTSDESKLIEKITEEGKKLAPHLADIAFPYMPFMNDIPFENLDYSGPGQTFYKRRTGGDLSGFNKGQQAFMKIMSNPGGIEIKDAMESMQEIIEGISSPEGDEFGMESNFATFESLLDVAMAKEGSRNALFKAIKEFTRNPTSKAQEWSGIKAESIVEGEVSNLLDTAVQKGLLPPELARYMKKKKHATLLFILWMIFRDVITLSPAILAMEFGSELMKDGK